MSGNSNKWFKGTRKAIERLPYRIAGTKPEEDPLIVRWTQDFHAARGALQHLLEYSKEADKSWHNLMDSNRDLLVAFLSCSKPIISGATAPANQELIEDQSQGLNSYTTVWTNYTKTDRGVTALTEEFYEVFKFRIQEALKEVKLVEALLAKVGRKQLDYDRKRVAHKKAVASENEAHIASADIEMRGAEDIYRNLLEYVKAMVPQFLAALDSLLHAMIARHTRFNQEVIKCWQQLLENSATAQGAKVPEAWSDIYEAWIHNFTRVQYLVESIPLLRDGSITHIPMSAEGKFGTSVAGQKILNVASAAAGTGEHAAASAYHSIRHLNVPDVAFVSTEGGIFASVGLEGIKQKSKAAEIAKPEFVLAKFDYSGEEGDLSFKAGDKIRVIDHGVEDDINWWCGEFDGKVGLFPRDFVYHTPEAGSQAVPEHTRTAGSAQAEPEAVAETKLETDAEATAATETVPETAAKPGTEPAAEEVTVGTTAAAVEAEAKPEVKAVVAEPKTEEASATDLNIAETELKTKSEPEPNAEVEPKAAAVIEPETKVAKAVESETTEEVKSETPAAKAAVDKSQDAETTPAPKTETVAASAPAVESSGSGSATKNSVEPKVEKPVTDTKTEAPTAKDCVKPVANNAPEGVEDVFDALSIDDEAPKSPN